MEKTQRVCISPCKQLNGECVISDFNRVLLTIAAEFDAALISNKSFNDIAYERPGKDALGCIILFYYLIIFYYPTFLLLEWQQIIDNNEINYTWESDQTITFRSRKGSSVESILEL